MPGGRGDQFITFLDHEESVRLLAMKILTSGRYTAPFSVWQSVTESKAFQHRSPSEKRIIFQIMCQMSGEDVISYCRQYRREPLSPDKVLKIMFAKGGRSFDPVLLKLFVNCVGIIPIRSLVSLDINELAVVMRPNPDRHWRKDRSSS